MNKRPSRENVVPFFQPVVCVDTGKIFAHEVLGREITPWGFASLGPFFHDPDISNAEKLIIDRKVRFTALEKAGESQNAGILFINIQPQWLLPFINADSFPTLEHLKGHKKLTGEQLVIEISEDYFGENDRFLFKMVQRYRDADCKIAVDDFGKGFSNYERIVQLHPDYIKIGAELFKGQSNQGIGSYVMESLGLLGEKTGASLVLEGVETLDLLLMGLDAGVRFFQGYFLARPGPKFLQQDYCTELVETALGQYHHRKVREQEVHVNFREEMNRYLKIENISLTTPHDFDNYVNRLMAFAPDGWMRAYVCHSHGHQLTPNYCRNGGGFIDRRPEYIGRNWCWRPYFLPKVAEARERAAGVLSPPYLDLETRERIYTFIYPLTADVFLFIDFIP